MITKQISFHPVSGWTLINNIMKAAIFMAAVLFGYVPVAVGAMSGSCVNCHTMHNSQGNASMATYGTGGWTGTGPNPALLRGTCIGCHAMGGAENIITISGSVIPQVYHTSATDLAGGNFAYILGSKGGGAANTKGHNVVDILTDDGALDGPPGGITQLFHNDGTNISDGDLTCAGTNGCHGKRYTTLGSGVTAMSGAHHGNVDGQLNTSDTVANSYRFLFGVKGLENPVDKWQNASNASHNEYYGAASPVILGCGGGETSCHSGADGIKPPSNTISGFCGTCHGDFHTLTGPGMGSGEGIGSSTTSPFIRHPSDIEIKNSGEYSSFTSYDVDTPVGRQAVPAAASGTVTPGSDVVTCLSCHMAHASDYPDMLRWDYNSCSAGTSNADCGCFNCHTTKDD